VYSVVNFFLFGSVVEIGLSKGGGRRPYVSMFKGKSIMAGICVVSLAIGYLVGRGKSPGTAVEGISENSSPERQTRQSSRDNRSRGGAADEMLSSILNGRNIKDIPPEEMAAIIAKFSNYDPDLDPLARARQAYQFQLLMAKLSPTMLEDIATAIKANPDPKNRDGLSGIVSALAAKDPRRALDWVAQQENSAGLLSLVIGGMAKDDPETAAHLLREAVLDGSIDNRSMWTASSAVTNEMAKLGADRLMDFVDSMPKRHQSNMLYNAIRGLRDEEKIKLLDKLHERKERGDEGYFNFEYIFASAYGSSQEQVEKWLEKIPDGEKKAELQASTANNLLQRGDTDGAKEWMIRAIAQSPGKEKEIFLKGIENMTYNNPEGISVFAALLPENVEMTAKDLENSARTSLYTGGNGLASVADAIRDPNEKASLIVSTLAELGKNSNGSSRMNATDMEILSRRVSEMGFTGQNAENVRAAMELVRNPKAAEGQ